MHFSDFNDGFEKNWVRSCLANDYVVINWPNFYFQKGYASHEIRNFGDRKNFFGADVPTCPPTTGQSFRLCWVQNDTRAILSPYRLLLQPMS